MCGEITAVESRFFFAITPLPPQTQGFKYVEFNSQIHKWPKNWFPYTPFSKKYGFFKQIWAQIHETVNKKHLVTSKNLVTLINDILIPIWLVKALVSPLMICWRKHGFWQFWVHYAGKPESGHEIPPPKKV